MNCSLWQYVLALAETKEAEDLDFCLIFLTGADSVSSVRRVTVQSGGSVTIPYLYEDRHKDHVKYWCRGIDWRSLRTDSPQKGDVSIRDDPEQQVFTVTMNNLKIEDNDTYCVSVEVTGVEGDSVSVQCRYGDSNSEKMFCKIGGSCVLGNSGSLDGRPVEIGDDRVNKVFSVTMWGLERKDTGWYRCDAGYQQIPVHITVNETTTAITEGNLYLRIHLLLVCHVSVLLLYLVITDLVLPQIRIYSENILTCTLSVPWAINTHHNTNLLFCIQPAALLNILHYS
uniref:Immunoglobulin domain-containing protein n=1 Tax=Paramormyrops kingsleyae TaxID=1676925 RepID=A0A3B3RCJ4_9TELE